MMLAGFGSGLIVARCSLLVAVNMVWCMDKFQVNNILYIQVADIAGCSYLTVRIEMSNVKCIKKKVKDNAIKTQMHP